MTTHPAGAQWSISHGDQEATIVEVGGGLRRYAVSGTDVVAGYRADEMASGGRGQVLMPWPNRIRDGRYTFAGTSRQLALTEPSRGNASHGLVRWLPWRLADLNAASLTVACRLFPQPGWDGLLDLSVTYTLHDDGLAVTPRATNAGVGAVPFGYGAHPYVALGGTPVGSVVLTVPASDEVLVDERKLPTGTTQVRPEVDFRSPRAVGSTRLDTAYTGLGRDADGRWAVRLSGLGPADAPRTVTVWGDEALRWVQVFTPPLDDPHFAGLPGIAVEPMSCPADAFNSGDGLVVLEPGQAWSASWGISSAAG